MRTWTSCTWRSSIVKAYSGVTCMFVLLRKQGFRINGPELTANGRLARRLDE
jgi:hypothetical protein